MKYGYFDNDNYEYVITNPQIPQSWTNYIGLDKMCSVMSHNAGGYSFFGSSEHHRISRFRPNAVPMDRPGHYLYIRDNDSGKYWSASWQPVGVELAKATYECRHGLSYSKFTSTVSGIKTTKTIFIPLADNCEIWDVKIENCSDKARQISIFSYLEFSFKHITFDNQDFQMSLYSSGSHFDDNIVVCELFYDPGEFFFFTSDFVPDTYDSVRDNFIGSYRTETNPIAVERGFCSSQSQLGGNHCGALHKNISIGAFQQKRFIFLVGSAGPKRAAKLREKYSDHTIVDKEFDNLKAHWRSKLSNFECSTPSCGFDTTVNIWNPYQVSTAVSWSRFASFIEVGGRGGIGYRDTAQDLMSIGALNPKKCKSRLVELYRAQMSAGYALHLFEPELFDKNKKSTSLAVTVGFLKKKKDMFHSAVDACADDALWIVPSTCEYLKHSGDFDFLDRRVPYADSDTANIYSHMKQALDFSLNNLGKHGIALGLRADWNDCLNLGGGESSMVSFNLHWALGEFVCLARFLGKVDDATYYEEKAKQVQKACNENLWDGNWFIRGFTKDGLLIGSARNIEGKIFLNAQSWAVFSGVASVERAKSSMDAVYKRLFSEYGLHLLSPAYTRFDASIGTVTRVYEGVKENGSIFSHANTWAIIAEAKLGRGNRAMEYYNAILPYNQNDQIQVRGAEPYSFCQFIMGKNHTHHGQARHPWLTGSAGWFYLASRKYILGIKPQYDCLVIDPCIPDYWKKLSVKTTFRDARYKITILNPKGVCKGVVSIRLNGKVLDGNSIPIQKAGTSNKVEVVLG